MRKLKTVELSEYLTAIGITSSTAGSCLMKIGRLFRSHKNNILIFTYKFYHKSPVAVVDFVSEMYYNIGSKTEAIWIKITIFTISVKTDC